MPDGPDLNVPNVVLASLPILILIVAMVWLRWSAPRAGALSWLVVAVLSLAFFGADTTILALGTSKGLSLALFVLSIIWTSVLLYNVIDHMGGIRVIGTTMTRLVADPLGQALVVGWAFAGFMQGVAGFGVPVAVVAPLLVLMGFSPARAAAIVLVGHAWAVTFGSLGSSFFTIQLVTDIEGDVIGPHMAAMFVLPTILTGFAVAHLQGGLHSMRRGAVGILIIGGAMSATVWLLAVIGAPQVASIVSGLLGCGVGWAVARAGLLGRSENAEATEQPAEAATKTQDTPNLGFHMAFLPYYLVLGFSVISQIPAIKELGATWHWGLDYPATLTGEGFAVDAQDDYAKIRLLRHPAPLILLSLAVSYLVYRAAGIWKDGAGTGAMKNTYSQVVSSSVGVSAMVMMALVMTDSGMTALLGRTIANGTSVLFPVFGPYIGVLGTFMTGSNTNSNVMFGALQLETARSLDIGTVTISSAQSIGGALGSAMAPAKVLVGTAIVGLSGRDHEVLRKTIPYTLIIVLLVGIQSWILINIFEAG